MIIQIGHKTELKLNNKQKTRIDMFFGGARFAYNWGLRKRIKLYEKEKKSTTYITQNKEFNKLKKLEYQWAYLYSKCVFECALKDLDKGFTNFFRGIKTNKKIGFPKFKSKKNPKQSFRLTGCIKVFSNQVQLPRLGILRLKESNYIPINERILSATVSKKANRYFVSIQIEKETELKPNILDKVIGIDLGIKNLAVTSDGIIFGNPKPYKNYLEKLKREQRRLNRKVIGSNNRRRQQLKIAKVHYKISNIRKDTIHKMTSVIVDKQPMTIVIENLAISNMIKNHNLAQPLLDSSFGEIKRQFEYKCKWNNIELVLANRFYPSSKLCSICGNKKEDLKLSDRIWNCSKCGNKLDRDLNAAINLSKYTVSSTGINASGEDKLQIGNNQWSSLKEEITLISNSVRNL
jgi:putative transposase